ncbi:hypothetical protein JCM19232_3937 [Vibrio ishigakensis]|uniref:Uncharacterized protein n=1 Tax=Vibrio ishigakensis TaxID=1481914 RepID=A0A0B8P2K4_9VIBR|nr:hypothetical protein JCM19232_3937 [Vibrio ishigakensis]
MEKMSGKILSGNFDEVTSYNREELNSKLVHIGSVHFTEVTRPFTTT